MTISPRTLLLAATALIGLAWSGVARADNEFLTQLTAFAKGQLHQIAADPDLVAAITAQNATTGGYEDAKIDALDKQWRAEVDAGSKPLIDATLATPASKALAAAMQASGGLITEIFATDAKGLNVAQATMTSDYWQGDEDKFTEVFPKGADGLFVSDVEQDESTQTYQCQVSITVTDASGTPIGTITAGVDVGKL